MTNRTTVVCFRLTHDERAWLEQIAAENQGTLAGVIRAAVGEFVADYREDSPPGFGRGMPGGADMCRSWTR